MKRYGNLYEQIYSMDNLFKRTQTDIIGKLLKRKNVERRRKHD